MTGLAGGGAAATTARSKLGQFAWPAAGLVVWALLPYALAGRLSLSILVLVLLYTPIVAGIAVLSGYAGQVSLGQAAFYGSGAYITAILTTRAGLSPWLGIPAAVLGSALLAYLVGRPILALRGHYLVIATLGLNIIVVVLLRQWSGLTGGANGLSGIPPLQAFGMPLRGDLFYYYATGVVALLALWASANLVRSRFGRALLFVRTSEAAAAAFAVDAARMKSLAFVWSAGLASLSGALYAHYVTFISPSPFDFTFSVELLVMAVVGGLASIPGAAVGCFLFVVLRQLLARALPATLGAGASAQAEVVVFGLILALVVVLAPEGLWPSVAGWWRKRRSARPAAIGADAKYGAPSGPSGAPAGEAGSRDAAPILAVREATRRFGGLTAVAAVSFDARPGEVLAIVGPNGAGKTTLFNLVSALVTPSSGTIRLLGRDVTRLAPDEVARLGVARTFQAPRLVPHLTALENAMLGLYAAERVGFAQAVLGLTGREEGWAREEASRALATVGASAFAGTRAADLPFGAQRLVELARALAARPRLLLLDEPASGLTQAERRTLAELVRAVRDRGTAVIVVEHDMRFVMELADRILVMHHGEAIAEGTPDEVRRNADVVAAYLGEADGQAAPAEPVPRGGPVGGPARARARGEVEAAAPLLWARGVEAGYGPIAVLRGVDIEVWPGQVAAVLGPNGAGKTTLLRAMSGIIPTKGEIAFDGRPLRGLPPERIAALGVVQVPERRQLFDTMTVEENLLLGAYTRARELRGRALRRELERVYALFPELAGKRGQKARSLSGGQQQMLALGRALLARPRVLLLDEPLLGLAPLVVRDILRAVTALRDEGLGVLLVEQNTQAVLPCADTAYVLQAGEVVVRGTAEEVAARSDLSDVILAGAAEGGGAAGNP